MSSVKTKAVSCGIDLGGTKVVVATTTPDGRILDKHVIRDHRANTEDEIIIRIAGAVRNLTAGSTEPLRGIGVGTSGHVDYANGVVISNSNLPGFANYPLARMLSDTVGTRVVVDNDANAQAYAEYRFGAGRGHDNMAFVTVSTGLGAGFVIGGRVYHGVTGIAGEIGHTIVNPAGTIRCGCGNTGCLMAHGSGLTLPENVRAAARERNLETSLDLETLEDGQITGELVGAGLNAGDPLCAEVVSEYAFYLGLGLHNMVQTMNPGVIVVGGGLTGWGPFYMDRVREVFGSFEEKTLGNPPEIRLSELGADAAVIGAAALSDTGEGENQ